MKIKIQMKEKKKKHIPDLKSQKLKNHQKSPQIAQKVIFWTFVVQNWAI